MRTIVVLPVAAAALVAGAIAAWGLGFASSLDAISRNLGAHRFLRSVTVYLNAISDGAEAAHEYGVLTRRGVPHAEAVARAFDAP
jgi:hypothetical protein